MTALWSIDEAARQLGGISPSTVRRLIKSGELPSVKIGARVLLTSTFKLPVISPCVHASRNRNAKSRWGPVGKAT